ncbi:hypothetical protein GCM10010112_63210 [Actinoplanes lobatus]|uniref:Uncharacterized protein n=1 Tax=Actinoplanes lobatus TaxID=113568 RepID=A0ABQ4AU37_9ACTN|nr:hypothetical protein GCM10010112_63210 [Actinoplanes lobatus]GIE44099.1 hypothetical protein Alo02nite_69970 [Actinoplanes lobatus]
MSRFGGPKARAWIADTFVRGLTGLPLALASVPMALTGNADRAARTQVRMAARFPGTVDGFTMGGRRPSTTMRRVLGHSMLVAIPATLAFAAVAIQLFTVWSGYLYPVRPDTIAAIGHPFTPDTEVLSGAWGGPTLMGAWAVHSCIAFCMQAICGALLVGLCKVQNAMTRRLAAVA